MDQAASNELLITQEGMASLLGVRREGVTAAALKLQHACECYAFSKKAYFKLLPLPLAA